MKRDERTGVERIAAERQRQIDKEGWTAEHDDDEHTDGELARAAVCYATPVRLFVKDEQDRADDGVLFADPWPWDERWDKRPRGSRTYELRDPARVPVSTRIRMLEKAGALIAAEIDRLLRAKAKP